MQNKTEGQMEWYEEENKVKVYSKYAIIDFWNWWSDKTNSWMEIRTTDWKQAKKLGTNFNIPYSHTGVFVNNAYDLKRVIRTCIGNHYNIWFGINPRKWNFNKFGTKGLSGGDHFVKHIKFLFIDIDRVTKLGKATNEDLKNADTVANLILDKLSDRGWNKNYIKVCSGNGIQLLIKLDIPITMPNVTFDMKTKTYNVSEEFNEIKKQIRQGIGQQLLRYINRKDIKEKYKVMIDGASFRIAQVGALHGTKNYKYDNNTWRGIVELKEGINEGLSDYILNVKTEKKKIFGRGTVQGVSGEDKLTLKTLREHKLVKLMLQSNLPEGGRNNYLVFSLKALLKENKIDINEKEVIQLFHDISTAWKDRIPLNPLDGEFTYSPAVVRKWCILNLVPPIYEKSEYVSLIEHKFFKEKYNFKDFSNNLNKQYDIFELSGKDIIEDCAILKELLSTEDLGGNYMYLKNFLIKCIEKYGKKATEYYYQYVIPEEVFYSVK